MRRRTVLSGLGTLAASALAGCLGGAGGDTPTSTPPLTPGPSPSPTTTPFPTATPAPEPTTEFEVFGQDCGQGTNDASVTFDGPSVRVSGTIGGNDSCYTASLERAEVEGGELAVVVAAVREEKAATAACLQCLVDIDYEARVGFAGPGPDRVTVIHESIGESLTVARAERP